MRVDDEQTFRRIVHAKLIFSARPKGADHRGRPVHVRGATRLTAGLKYQSTACNKGYSSRSRIDHVRGLSRSVLSSYKGATDSWNVRARQPGTHARPAAGGVSSQVRTVAR